MVANEYNLQNSGNGVDQMEDTNWRSFVALVFLFIASFLKCICNVYEMNSWHTREGFSEANLKVFHFWTHFSFLSKYIFTNTHHHHNHTIDDDNCMCILYIPVCIGWFQHFDGFDVLNSLCDPFFSFYFFIIYNSNTIFVFIEMIFFFLFFFFLIFIRILKRTTHMQFTVKIVVSYRIDVAVNESWIQFFSSVETDFTQ